MEKKTISINGMTCGHCVQTVKQALAGIEGVRVESVRVGEATIDYDPVRVSDADIAAAVARQGYTVAAG